MIPWYGLLLLVVLSSAFSIKLTSAKRCVRSTQIGPDPKSATSRECYHLPDRICAFNVCMRLVLNAITSDERLLIGYALHNAHPGKNCYGQLLFHDGFNTPTSYPSPVLAGESCTRESRVPTSVPHKVSVQA